MSLSWGYVEVDAHMIGPFDILGIVTDPSYQIRYGDMDVIRPDIFRFGCIWEPEDVSDAWVLDLFILGEHIRSGSTGPGCFSLGWMQLPEDKKSLMELRKWLSAAGLGEIEPSCHQAGEVPDAWVFEYDPETGWELRGLDLKMLEKHLGAHGNPIETKRGKQETQPQAHLTLSKDESGQTALHHAASQGDVAEVTRLLELGGNPNSPDFSFQTALHVAARENAGTCVSALLRYGAEWQIRNIEGQTPLHMAARQGATEAASILLQAGGNPDAEMRRGITPLQLASWNGHQEVISVLIEAGADITRVNEDGNTCLHFAAGNNQIKMLKVLIGFGANPKVCNGRGLTYLETVNEGYSGDPIPVIS